MKKAFLASGSPLAEAVIDRASNTLGHVMLIVQLDNLGKGAAGAAGQHMYLMLGMAEDVCLTG